MPKQPNLYSHIKLIKLVTFPNDDVLLAYILISFHNGQTFEAGRISFKHTNNPTVSFTNKRSAFLRLSRLAGDIGTSIQNLHEFKPVCPQCGSYHIMTRDNPPFCIKCNHTNSLDNFCIERIPGPSIDEAVVYATPLPLSAKNITQ